MPRTRKDRHTKTKYGGCFNVQNMPYDMLPYPKTVKKQHLCFRVDDGTPCCMALCSNGYRCQNKGSFVAKIELENVEQISCDKLVDIPKSELIKIRQDEIILCEHHAKQWTKNPAKKKNYISTFAKASGTALCVAAVSFGLNTAILSVSDYLGVMPHAEYQKKMAAISTASGVIGGIGGELIKGVGKDYVSTPVFKWLSSKK